jgi:hypothetical protein
MKRAGNGKYPELAKEKLLQVTHKCNKPFKYCKDKLYQW